MTTRFSFSALPLLASILLIGCGGGGGDGAPSPGPSAEGVYAGKLAGSASSDFELLVLENDEYWTIYGMRTPSMFAVTGFLQGTGKSNNGSFTSSNARDFGLIPAASGVVDATYDATAKTISGTVQYESLTVGFSGGPISDSLYDYDTPASLTTITGTWTASTLQGEVVSLDVASNGAFTTFSNLGCTASGNVSPRPSGKNVFNVFLTFGPAPCALPGQTATGIAVAYPLANGQTQLIVGVVDASRSMGTAVFGTR